MQNKKSVHLEYFPTLNNFESDTVLINKMDKIRAICSLALYIRDKNNLRVRLPLNKITIISKEIEDIKEYSSIIMDETNIKNIEFLEDIENYGRKKIILNFQKIGDKVGSKMPNLIKATKNDNWKITKDEKLEIEGFILEKDEYSSVWEAKKDNFFAVNNYDILICLDINLTKELESEGLARDIVRMIQQYRRDAKLVISDKINLLIKTNYDFLRESIIDNKEYIKEQTLTVDLEIATEILDCEFSFGDEINNYQIQIGFNIIK